MRLNAAIWMLVPAMSFATQITETVILHLQKGVNLEDVASLSNHAAKTFSKLAKVVEEQDGFQRQYWGHQVEGDGIFVWSIDWDSIESSNTFDHHNKDYYFKKGINQLFNLEIARPFKIYTQFTGDKSAALAAPFTEVIFFTISTPLHDQAGPLIEQSPIPPTHPAITIGHSVGAASGYVLKAKNTRDALPANQSLVAHYVFGWNSIADHRAWRDSPEYAAVQAQNGKSPLATLGLRQPKMPGGGIFVNGSSIFHVKYQAVC